MLFSQINEFFFQLVFILSKHGFENLHPRFITQPSGDGGCQLPVLEHPDCTFPVNQFHSSSTRIFDGIIWQCVRQRRCFLARVRIARDWIARSEAEGIVQRNYAWEVSTESNGLIRQKLILRQSEEATYPTIVRRS